MYPTQTPYILQIDTNQYAGNFEREMCAYVTGITGDCGVGEEEAQVFLTEASAEKAEEICDIIDNVADGTGCYRPCAVGQDNKGESNAVAIYFTDSPSQEQVDFMVERIKAFPKYYKGINEGKLIKIKAIRLIQQTVKVTLVEKILS